MAFEQNTHAKASSRLQLMNLFKILRTTYKQMLHVVLDFSKTLSPPLTPLTQT